MCVGVFAKQSFAVDVIFTSVTGCFQSSAGLNKQSGEGKKGTFLFSLSAAESFGELEGRRRSHKHRHCVGAQGEHTAEEETDHQVT